MATKLYAKYGNKDEMQVITLFDVLPNLENNFNNFKFLLTHYYIFLKNSSSYTSYSFHAVSANFY